MGAVENHFQPGEIGAGGHAALAELDIAPRGIVDPRNLAQTGGLDHRHRRVEQFLDDQLHLVRQLGALAGEELDAVVVVRVVRGADDDARLGVEGAGQVGDARSRHRPEQHHVGTGSRQTSLQRGFEHVTGNPRVLADQYAALALLAEGHAHCPTQLEHEIRSDRRSSYPPANPVGAEIFSAHA
ncbi:hypothetical protein D3C76_802300 [compost metagenome]